MGILTLLEFVNSIIVGRHLKLKTPPKYAVLRRAWGAYYL